MGGHTGSTELRSSALAALAGLRSDKSLLQLVWQLARPELDDLIAALFVAFADEIDDECVTVLDWSSFNRHELSDTRAQRVELVLEQAVRNLRLALADLELAPVGQLG